MPDEKKVDQGWKKKVQDEKGPQEQAQESQAAEEQPQDESAEEPLTDKIERPQPEFTVLVSSLATQALIGLGLMEHPISKTKEPDLDSAKFSIDLLQMLTDKTRGNLTDLEKRYLEAILYDIRMKFVEISSK